MLAILSDIHGNLEALQAVLEGIAQYPQVEAILCLGDLLGYGPNPCECVDLAMQWQVTLLGSYDRGVLTGFWQGGTAAERSILWSHQQMHKALRDLTDEGRWEFLARLPATHRQEGRLFVHGSARNPVYEYVFPEDIYSPRKMEQIFALVERYCFQGHTHVPGIFTENLQFLSPEKIDYAYPLNGRKTLCNVGSVGQPRDGDWRACYVLLEDDTIYYRRAEYDVNTTIQKIYAVPELANFLGDRLREGR
jgi:diadenosine tetraphosphatase ApaH/serine/threonine PP2A family protein phosphatase